MGYTAASYTSVFHKQLSDLYIYIYIHIYLLNELSLLSADCSCVLWSGGLMIASNLLKCSFCQHGGHKEKVLLCFIPCFTVNTESQQSMCFLSTACSNLCSPLWHFLYASVTNTRWHTDFSGYKVTFPGEILSFTNSGRITARQSKTTVTYQLVSSLTCGVVLFLTASCPVKPEAVLFYFLWVGLLLPPDVKLQTIADTVLAREFLLTAESVKDQYLLYSLSH